MRLLVDNNLPPRLTELLGPAGWDVVRPWACDRHRTVRCSRRPGMTPGLLSADTDFGALLAASHAVSPSVVLIRRSTGRRAETLAALLAANLPALEADFAAGSVVVIGEDNLRVRRLPIG